MHNCERSERRGLSEYAALQVIASGAKQSILPLAEAWIASSLSLLAMTGLGPIYISNSGGDTRLHSRGSTCPSFARISAHSDIEGAGKAGCALHPRSRVQFVQKKCAHEYTGEAEALRLSLRSGLTAYSVLSSVNGLSCHRRPQKRGFLRTWRQHRGARTTRLRRTLKPRSSVVTLASTASHRAFVTIATRPSHRVRRGESKTDSSPSLSDLFFSEGLDGANRVDIAAEFSLNAHAAVGRNIFLNSLFSSISPATTASLSSPSRARPAILCKRHRERHRCPALRAA
jgi:hypothetical protein